MNCDRAAGDHHDRGEVEGVKSYPGKQATALHHVERKTKDVSSISQIAFQLETDPAKYERKGNQGRQYTAPHNQEVHGPTRKSAPRDEPLLDQVGSQSLRRAGRILQKLLAL